MYEKEINKTKRLAVWFFSLMIFAAQFFLSSGYLFKDPFMPIDFWGLIVLPPSFRVIFLIGIEIGFFLTLITFFSMTFSVGQGSPLFLSDMKDGGEYKIVGLGPEIKGFKYLLLVSARKTEDKHLFLAAWFAIPTKRIDGHPEEGTFVIKSESGCIIPVSSGN